MVTIAPRSTAIILGATAGMRSQTSVRFTASDWSHISRGIASEARTRWMPTFATKIVGGPRSYAAASVTASTASRSATSRA